MRRLLILALFACGLSGPAWAQDNSTVTTSTSRTPDTFVDTTLAPININTFSTRLIGLLQGDPTLYFDQTFAFAFADPAVQGGVLAAQSALGAATPDPLSFFGPTLLSSLSSLLSSNMTTTVLGNPLLTETVGFGDSIGPTTIQIGDLGLCAGLQTTTFPFPYVGGFSEVIDYPFGCSGGTGPMFTVVPGSTNLNVNLNSQFQFTREIQTTNTFSVLDTWRILGVRPTTSVPEPGTLVLLTEGLLGLALLRRRRLLH